MTPGFKGTLWIAFILSLFLAAHKAHAGTEKELRDLLDDKQIVYKGTCWFDQQGILTFKNDLRKVTEQCVVGMKLPDQTKHYVLLYGDKGATKLILFDETTKSQEVLWSRARMT